MHFETFADGRSDNLYGELMRYCEALNIDLFAMLNEETNNYN